MKVASIEIAACVCRPRINVVIIRSNGTQLAPRQLTHFTNCRHSVRLALGAYTTRQS